MAKKYSDLSPTRGAEDKIRALLRLIVLLKPSLKRGRGRPPKVKPLSRPEQIMYAFAGEYAWKQYSEWGVGNHMGLKDDRRTWNVDAEDFVKYLLNTYPHTLLRWVQLETRWLKGEVDLEPEPTPEEMGQLEASIPLDFWTEAIHEPEKVIKTPPFVAKESGSRRGRPKIMAVGEELP